MKVGINRNLALKIVFFLYFLHFILSYHNGVWEFGGDKYGMMPIYANTVNIIRFVYLISLLALGLYEMVIQIKKMTQIDRALMVVFLTLSLWKLIEVSKLVDAQTLLFQAGTPMMYLVFLAFFIGMDDKVETDLLILSKRYGFIYVDRDEDDDKAKNAPMKRYRKDSFYWYKKVITTNGKELD